MCFAFEYAYIVIHMLTDLLIHADPAMLCKYPGPRNVPDQYIMENTREQKIVRDLCASRFHFRLQWNPAL